MNTPIQLLKYELEKLEEKLSTLKIEIGDHVREELFKCKAMIRLYKHSIKKLKK